MTEFKLVRQRARGANHVEVVAIFILADGVVVGSHSIPAAVLPHEFRLVAHSIRDYQLLYSGFTRERGPIGNIGNRTIASKLRERLTEGPITLNQEQQTISAVQY